MKMRFSSTAAKIRQNIEKQAHFGPFSSANVYMTRIARNTCTFYPKSTHDVPKVYPRCSQGQKAAIYLGST